VASDLRELGEFFKTEIWDHFQKEEEALFPEIEKFLPREKGPTGQMLREHEDLRETNERFQRGIACYLADPRDGQAAALIQSSGRYIIDLLRNHIHKEDNVLFRMADMHLTEAQNRQILDLFEAIEAGA
jgi:hemerythrin-like domain-containing protein